MAKKHIESILGQPTSEINRLLIVVITAKAFTDKRKESVTIVFKDSTKFSPILSGTLSGIDNNLGGLDERIYCLAELERKFDKAIAQYPADKQRSAGMPLLHL